MKLSALLSVHNGERYLEESIRSVLNQTYRDFEFLIVDDGSTDGSVNIIQSIGDPRVRLLALSSNQGVGAALRFGVTQCKGDFIVKIDGDDVYHPQKFQKQLDYMERTSVDVLGTLVSYFPDTEEIRCTPRFQSIKRNEPIHNAIITHDDIGKVIFTCKPMQHPTYMIRRDLLLRNNYHPLRIGEDHDLFLRLYMKGCTFFKLPEILTYVRTSAKSTVSREMADKDDLLKVYDRRIENRIAINPPFFKNPFYIWGAGRYGHDIYRTFVAHGLRPRGFVDTHRAGRYDSLSGLDILAPGDVYANRLKVFIASVSGAISIILELNRNNLHSYIDYM